VYVLNPLSGARGRYAVNIGRPKRIIEVEPISLPLPDPSIPMPEPGQAPAEPIPAPVEPPVR
jgi:hypothetical protein